MYQDLSIHHGWAVENATVHLPIKLTGNLKHITGNIRAAQMLLPRVRLYL